MRNYAVTATVAILLIIQAVGEGNNVEQPENEIQTIKSILEDETQTIQSVLEAETQTIQTVLEDETQTIPSVSEEPHKYVHILHPGEREYLSPNLIGLQNIAMTFLPASMKFVNVFDAYREIVNGFRYEIFLNAINKEDNNADIICRLVILEKPRTRDNLWGDRVRELQHSNCTVEGTDFNSTPLPVNDVNDKYVKSTIFNGGSRNELSEIEMKRLDDQIFPSAISYNRMPSNNNNNIITDTAATSEKSTTEEQTTISVEEDDEHNTTIPTAQEGDSNVTELPQHEIRSSTITSSTTTSVPKLSDDEKKWLDDFFSIDVMNFENNLNTVSTGHKDDNIHDNLQTQVQIEEPVIHRTKREHKNEIVGNVVKLPNDEAKKQLQTALDQLATGDGGPSLNISKIHAATKQVVSGTLTKIDCDLIDAEGVKRCEVQIWSRIWQKDGNEITINCPKKDLIKKRYRRSTETAAEKKTQKKQDNHNLSKVKHLFSKFQIKYNRRYETSMERQMRLRIFEQNLEIINQLNQNEMGSAKYGVTEFADLTSAEFKQRTGLWQRDPLKAAETPKATIPDVTLPKEFDWRLKGVVSPVKNQGSCGSCWAFSVTGNIEGLHAVKTGKLENYSEQELIDCDTTDSGCNGGLPDNAYEALEKIGGLELETEYPYHARKEQCHFAKNKVHVKVKGHVDLPKNESAMAQWLIVNGPISIGINANAMQFYRGGVSHPWHALCSRKNLDHGVLIVGFGVSEYPSFHKILPYWIVKNSWGNKWGEQGYYRVYRGDNTCGVSEMASSAVLDD